MSGPFAELKRDFPDRFGDDWWSSEVLYRNWIQTISTTEIASQRTSDSFIEARKIVADSYTLSNRISRRGSTRHWMKVQWQVSIAKEGRWMGPLAAFVLGTTAFFSRLLFSAQADEVLLFDSRGSRPSRGSRRGSLRGPSHRALADLRHLFEFHLFEEQIGHQSPQP